MNAFRSCLSHPLRYDILASLMAQIVEGKSGMSDLSRPSKGEGRASAVRDLAPIIALLALVPLIILYLDASIRTFILSVQEPPGMMVARWVSAVGYGLLDAAFAGILMAVGHLMGRPREAVAGRLGLFAVIVGGLSVQLFKRLFCRGRPLTEVAGQFFAAFPCLGEGYRLISFPSGHSVTAFALAYVLSRTYPKGSFAFYLLASMVAFSRVYLASHFLSDVVAGAAAGLLAGWMVCRFAGSQLADARS